ncbi:MAG: nickel pincer cofactor biosynthesis protein LarB, partial [Planctomycetaceae bacterium]|nr:nickel pincer cofactor biosynthesis protein LarB [Planctomycetaceae bacterium]
MSVDDDFSRLLRDRVAAGTSLDTLLREMLSALSASDGLTTLTEGTRLDLDRQRRCGHPEVIYAPGKTVDVLVKLIARLADSGQDVLATRVTDSQADAAIAAFPRVIWNATARTLRQLQPDADDGTTGRVVVLTAGTSDRGVAEEAVETLTWMRVGCDLITDVGVAGPWRLLEQLPRLAGASAVIVVAGMEGALPSVVGGWVPCPVIAVPTSVGYGAAFSGLTAVL